MQGVGRREVVGVGERKGSEERKFPDPVPSLRLEPDIALLPERGRSPLLPSFSTCFPSELKSVPRRA